MISLKRLTLNKKNKSKQNNPMKPLKQYFIEER